MDILVINMIAGRLDRLEALAEQIHDAPIGAVFVLGNLVERPAPSSAPGEGAHAEQTYAAILARIGSLGVPIYLIPGAHDPPVATISRVVQAYAGPAPIHLVHRSATGLGASDVVAGFGGRLTRDDESTDTVVAFPTWEARVAFEHLHAYSALFRGARRRMLLFAMPPQGAHVDRETGISQGLPALNSLIRAYQPVLVCCGGPAAGRGVETISGTTIVNPGWLSEGSYALIDMDSLSVRLRRLPEAIPLDATFRSIVVALDGSPEAWRAFELAATLATRAGAQLTLVYAWEPISVSRGQPYLDEMIASRMAVGERLLAAAGRCVPEVVVDHEILEGPAATAIARVAEAHAADLIAMGARGLGGLRAALGSVSQRVLHEASCPVLIAREPPRSTILLELSAALHAEA